MSSFIIPKKLTYTTDLVPRQFWSLPEAIGVQYLSELRLRMGPTPCVWEWECVCRLEELMTEGPWRSGVMGVAAEVGG